jgi:hypothetical protein
MTFGLKLSAVAVLGVMAAGLVEGCSPADVDGKPTTNSQAGTASSAGTSAGGASAGTGTTPTSGSAGAPSSSGSPSTGGTGNPTAGSSAGGSAAGSSAGGTAGGSAGGSAGGVLCPADATFCSGFEETTQPPKTTYIYNGQPNLPWTTDFEVDTTLFHNGKSSLRVKSGANETGASGSALQMLAVEVGMGSFWARMYLQQTEFDIGLNDMGGAGEHNAYAGASDSDQINPAVFIEFAEDIGLAFNTKDEVARPDGYGYVNGGTKGFSLPKGMWHCIEINFNSDTREQKLYVNGTLQIDATDYPKTVANPIKFFRFGFAKFHGPARKVWFDDIAVGPTRAGCL